MEEEGKGAVEGDVEGSDEDELGKVQGEEQGNLVTRVEPGSDLGEGEP